MDLALSQDGLFSMDVDGDGGGGGLGEGFSWPCGKLSCIRPSGPETSIKVIVSDWWGTLKNLCEGGDGGDEGGAILFSRFVEGTSEILVRGDCLRLSPAVLAEHYGPYRFYLKEMKESAAGGVRGSIAGATKLKDWPPKDEDSLEFLDASHNEYLGEKMVADWFQCVAAFAYTSVSEGREVCRAFLDGVFQVSGVEGLWVKNSLVVLRKAKDADAMFEGRLGKLRLYAVTLAASGGAGVLYACALSALLGVEDDGDQRSAVLPAVLASEVLVGVAAAIFVCGGRGRAEEIRRFEEEEEEAAAAQVQEEGYSLEKKTSEIFKSIMLGLLARSSQIILGSLLGARLSAYPRTQLVAAVASLQQSADGASQSAFLLSSFALILEKLPAGGGELDALLDECVHDVNDIVDLCSRLGLKYLCDAIFLLHITEPALVDGEPALFASELREMACQYEY